MALNSSLGVMAILLAEPLRLTKQRLVLRRPTPIAVTGRLILRIRLRLHNHAPKQMSIRLAFHQPTAHQLRSHHLCRSAEERERQSWEILGDGLGGYESGSSTTEIADWCNSRNISLKADSATKITSIFHHQCQKNNSKLF